MRVSVIIFFLSKYIYKWLLDKCVLYSRKKGYIQVGWCVSVWVDSAQLVFGRSLVVRGPAREMPCLRLSLTVALSNSMG